MIKSTLITIFNILFIVSMIAKIEKKNEIGVI